MLFVIPAGGTGAGDESKDPFGLVISFYATTGRPLLL